MDKEATAEAITKLYALINRKKPQFIFCESPKDAQYKIAQEEQGLVGTNKEPKVSYVHTQFLGSMNSYWIAYYLFAEEYLGIVYDKDKSELLHIWADLAKACSWFWCYEDFCFVSDKPDLLKFNGNKLHCEDGPAVHYTDGYEIYFWLGVEVDKRWILDKQSITKEEILREDNAEKRRCIREILGAKKYYEVIAGENGLILIDEDTDDKGFPMSLYETSLNDDIINKKVQFLEVTCPSTERVYNIFPPNQKSKNVWDAKASTFNYEKIAIRHGDVGLVAVGKDYEKPIYES